ncbi:unnamed protein product [Arctia plantaginis]|uniref:Endonuclease/exonuclease/phosphatase domain-containing protein n=1 Tax=Arctia plantaginis TaxID=874455 RepID=A0A8S1BDC0_ARCPL|nr:unnamed protein product [Arctia plantaginis]
MVVRDPTRISSSSASLIDLIITDSPRMCKSVSVHHNPVLSDHAMVILEFNIEKFREPPRYISKRSLHKIDQEKFCTDLKHISWNDIMALSDVDDQIQRFNEMLLNLFNKHAPLIRYKIYTRPTPWITQNVKLMMTIRDKALDRARKSNNDAHLDYYRNLRNYVTGAIEREKTAFFNFYVNNNKDKPKQMWNQLKSICPLSSSDTLMTVPHHLCDPNKINNFFLDVPGKDILTRHVQKKVVCCCVVC